MISFYYFAMKIIYLAGGCFWGMEAYYKLLEGVIDTEVGYANGNKENPKYEELKAHIANHAETLKFVYDDGLFKILNNKTISKFNKKKLKKI